MRWLFGLALGAALAVTGLTACLGGDDHGKGRAAALVNVAGTGGQPFQRNGAFGIPVNDVDYGSGFVVPSGKLLVIEEISGYMLLPSGQEPYKITVSTNAGAYATHYLTRPLPTTGNGNIWLYSDDVTLYAQSGSTVMLFASRSPSTSGSVNVQWAFSGYLVDPP